MRPSRLFPLALSCVAACGSEIPRAPTAEAPTREEVARAKEPSAAPARLRVAVVSDLNGSYGSTSYGEGVHRAVSRITELDPDLVLSTGDMVAGQRAGLDYHGMWAGFHAAVSDRLAESGIPFAVSPGNHDASAYSRFAHERAVYVEEWRARRPELSFLDERDYPLRYTFTAGPALFVALDSTVVGPLDDDQMSWLDTQLELGEHYPVKIVFGHVPLYPFAEGRQHQHIGDRSLEALLRRHDVSLFVSGHHHAYYPGARGSLRMVSTACLGGGARRLIGGDELSQRSLVLFEITDDGIRGLDAWSGLEFDRPIERTSLPSFVGLPDMRIDRDDLVLDLGPSISLQ